LTTGVQANILVIHDKLVQLFGKERGAVGTHVLLQGNGADSLRWSDAMLEDFLARDVKGKFGVVLQRRHVRCTMNGMEPTIGDLSIAISAAIQRQHRPRRSAASSTNL
jgi:hypothetical protein